MEFREELVGVVELMEAAAASKETQAKRDVRKH
jgi:hypothetical protein